MKKNFENILNSINEELDFSVVGRNRDRDRERDRDSDGNTLSNQENMFELDANFEF